MRARTFRWQIPFLGLWITLVSSCEATPRPNSPVSSVPITPVVSLSAKAEPPMPKNFAYADMSRTLGTVTKIPVRGRIVNESAAGLANPNDTTPMQQASQNEIKGVEFEATLLHENGTLIAPLGKALNDKEGYIDSVFPLKEGAVLPGRYRVEIQVAGRTAGQTTVQLFSDDYQGAVVRSDIDLTYLDTHFVRKRDLAKLLTQKGSERKTLPAMEQVYAALRKGATGNEDRGLVFVSGSPRFFKRILESKMQVDGVDHNGIMLKAFEEIAFTQIINFDPERIISALKEQVGYKLGHLLRGRLELPIKAAEILLGDDSEADFVVYSIYHRLMSGELSGDAAKQELLRGGVDAGQIPELLELAGKVRETLHGFSPVKAIYINLTGFPNAKLAVKDWRIPELLREHQGAWPLILDLHEEGFVSKESVATVKARLLELGATATSLNEAGQAAVKSGYLKNKSPTL
jgi:hypothetical protein